MLRKTIGVMLLLICVLMCDGCYRKEVMYRSELKPDHPYDITALVLLSGDTVKFVRGGGEFEYGQRWGMIAGDSVAGWVRDGTQLRPVRYALSDVASLTVRRVSAGNTFLAAIGITVGVTALAVAIVFATKESCPFVYTFDGKNYWFDGEPYGGATCPALQRTDYSRLDSLKPVHGEYRLRLTNEVEETQYTDELRLMVVDHPRAVQVVPDAQGQLYTVTSPQAASRVTDREGRDITKWLSASDPLIWESNLSGRNPADPTDLRDSLVFRFPKPPGADRAKLVANVGTTLWGSQMLKRYEELWGDQLSQWDALLTTPMGKQMLDEWNRREEAYSLQVKVWAHDHWTVRGDMLGGGPFLSEDRVIPLDLEGVEGDSVCVLLTPPLGFWQLNWLAVDYSPEVPVTTQMIDAASAIGHEGNDLRAILASSDGQYYSAPEIGQTADLSFVAPTMSDGQARTVFARVSGYYDIHHDNVSGRQDSILTRIQDEPGYFTRYALEEYNTWLAEYTPSSGR